MQFMEDSTVHHEEAAATAEATLAEADEAVTTTEGAEEATKVSPSHQSHPASSAHTTTSMDGQTVMRGENHAMDVESTTTLTRAKSARRTSRSEM